MRGDGVNAVETGLVRQRLAGSVLVLALRHPPVNALSVAVRLGLLDGLIRAEADAAVKAVLLVGDGRVFSAGADIADLDAEPAQPLLSEVCTRIEACTKPVIALLRGAVLGGGLELALAAHYRLAHDQARLGFPEIALGLIPGAGGTQRLPRLIGAEQALRMLLSGKSVPATEALAMGLVDQVVDEHPMVSALQLAGTDLPPRPTMAGRRGLRETVFYQAAVRRIRAQPSAETSAAARAIDCVEAALLLPAEQVLQFERSAFEDLATSPQSAALRHVFRAERRASHCPAAIAAPRMPNLTRIGIWGASRDSADLALRALQAGLRVTLADPVRDHLTSALHHIAARADKAVEAGRMTSEARDADWARLNSTLLPSGLLGADLIVTPAQAGPLPDTPQAVPQIALGRLPEDPTGCVGLSLGAGRNGLIEVLLDRNARPAWVARAVALAQRMGGRVVFCGPGGPISVALHTALTDTLTHLRDTGTPADTIAALRAQFGAEPQDARHASPPALIRTCLAVLANVGARLLDSGTAHRPGDIDAVAVLSGLMPRASGGPMFQADLRGLLVLRADLRAAGDAPLFTPHPLIDRLISGGGRFTPRAPAA